MRQVPVHGPVGSSSRKERRQRPLLAARREADTVRLRDFSDALSKIQLGAERRIVVSPDERRRTAYHEAGHALLGMLTPGADPVRKISIVPRGHAPGVTFSSPDSDRYFYGEAYLRGRIAGMLGGRAAEQLVYGDVTTGAESDLEQATALARQMVGRWGMSEAIGAMSVLTDPPREQLLGLDGTAPSPATRELVEAEARRILNACAQQALEVLTRESPRLERLVERLLEVETLEADDIYRASDLPLPQDAAADRPALLKNAGRSATDAPRPGGPLVPVGSTSSST